MRAVKLTLFPLLLLVIGGALVLVMYRVPRVARPGAAQPLETALPATALQLIAAQAEVARASAEAPQQGGGATQAAPPELDDAGLRAALAHLASVLDRGGPELEAALLPLLRDPRTAQRVLALLVSGELAVDPEALTAEELGAVAAVFYAFELYNSDGADLTWMVAGVDGHAFGSAVLAALPEIAEPARGWLAERLSQASVDGRFVLDPSWLHEILALRRAHPELREMYGSLIENMGAGLGEEERQSFYALFLTESDDPTLVKVALSQLLASERPETYLVWAAELWAQSEALPEMRNGIAQAVATAAPPELAARFLGSVAESGLLGAFHALGGRAGGPEALAGQYDELVTSSLAPTARRMLVSGMLAAGEGALIGIASTDPDASVRGQALVTLTLSGSPLTSASVEALRTGYAERDDPYVGVPLAWTTMAAANMLRNGGDTGVRAQALDLLREIAEDTTVSPAERRGALDSLSPWVTPELRATIAASIP